MTSSTCGAALANAIIEMRASLKRNDILRVPEWVPGCNSTKFVSNDLGGTYSSQDDDLNKVRRTIMTYGEKISRSELSLCVKDECT